MILSGQSIGDIKQWQYIGREIKLFSYKNKGNNPDVSAFVKLNEIILSWDGTGNIKFWGYKSKWFYIIKFWRNQ